MRHRVLIKAAVRRSAQAAALAGAAWLLTACGGGGGDGDRSGGGPAPNQPRESVPDSAMASVSNFFRFMANWAADDTVEPLLLDNEEAPVDDGEARPVG